MRGALASDELISGAKLLTRAANCPSQRQDARVHERVQVQSWELEGDIAREGFWLAIYLSREQDGQPPDPYLHAASQIQGNKDSQPHNDPLLSQDSEAAVSFDQELHCQTELFTVELKEKLVFLRSKTVRILCWVQSQFSKMKRVLGNG